jgi:hypothetical protein
MVSVPEVAASALTVNAALPDDGVTASVTVIKSESDETAVISASDGKAKSVLVIVTISFESGRMFKFNELEFSAGSVTVTFTTKSVRPAALNVMTAASAVAEVPVMLKVAVPLTGLTDS